MSAHRTGECGKRCYASRRQAKLATRTAHNTVRVYWCVPCRAFHVTNRDRANQW